jgi:hypothetical protein
MARGGCDERKQRVMSERAMSLLLALGALVLFYLLFIGAPVRILDAETPRPTSAESQGAGYSVARAWLERSGVRVVSWRDRYTRFSTANLPARGNLLIVTLPAATQTLTEEFLPLDRWVRAGNYLLVLAALHDKPEWASDSREATSGELQLFTGLEFQKPRVDPAAAEGETPEATDEEDPEVAEALRDLASERQWIDVNLLPSGAHPLLSGVRRLVAKSEESVETWPLQLPSDDFAIALAVESVGDGMTPSGALFVRAHGEGRIIVSTAASLFSNRALDEADNARLLANIVEFGVANGGAVLFDDLRQGLSANYDPARFWRDSRVYWTVAVLLALWLIWVLGGTALKAAPRVEAAPDEAGLVTATGDLLARSVKPSDAAMHLIGELFRGLPSAHNDAADSASWTWLQQRPQVRTADVAALQRWYTESVAGRRVNLLDVQRTVYAVRQQLAGVKMLPAEPTQNAVSSDKMGELA